jgi:tRNA A-37 threonylcarbamoyl transferase component Bud32
MRMVATLAPQGTIEEAPRCESEPSSTRLNPGSQPHAAAPRMYRVVRARGTGYAVNGFSRECLARLIDYPEIVLRMKSTETVKAGRTALLVKGELPVGGRQVGVAFKRIRRRNWVKVLSALFRANGTLRNWRMGHELLSRGVATARPLAVIVPHRHTAGRESFLVTEWIPDAANLHQYCRSLERRGARAARTLLHAAAGSLGSLVGRLHALNISHRDLKFGNLIVADRGTRVDAYVVDLDGAVARTHLPHRVRCRNVARLAADARRYACVTRSARLRFLKAYLAAAGCDPRQWKHTWRDIEKLTRSVKSGPEARRPAAEASGSFPRGSLP